MASEEEASLWSLLKRPKIDYVIICVAFLFLASNQVFAYTPFNPTGAIDVSLGSSIPQDTNYTLTEISDQPIKSAIIFNESMERNFLYVDVAVDAMNRTICNITLQSPSDNNPVDIYIEFGHYQSHLDVVVGQEPVTYTFIPPIDDVKYSDYLSSTCYVSINADVELVLRNVMLWVEFEVPVSPLLLDYKTTDGYDLFENDYTRWINMDGLEFDIIRLSDGMRGWIDVEYQNYTLYLPSQNYTMTSLWGNEYDSRIEFNVTLHENITTHCLLHMKAVRVYFTIDSNFPLIRLGISKYNAYSPNIEIYFTKSEIPDYVYIPPYALFDVEIATITPFSRYRESEDLTVQVRISSNTTNDYHVNVILPYIDLIGITTTPQDIIQIALALFLFILMNVRLFSYLYFKKPRTTWKDPRLIPILFFGVIACLPWYGETQVISSLLQYPIQIASLGVFPLMGFWVDSSPVFLILPPNALFLATLAIIFFWIPLLYANYYATPPSNRTQNFMSSILLFSPFLLARAFLWNLNEVFRFSLQYNFPIFIALVPLVYLLCTIILPYFGLYNYGQFKDQLSFDVKWSPQTTKSKIAPSAQGPIRTQRYSDEGLEVNPQKIINLVTVTLLSILLLLPTTYDFVIRNGGNYANYYVSPINALQKLLIVIFGVGITSALWILTVPLFILFAVGLWYNLAMKSRPILSVILLIIWMCIPFIFLFTLSGVTYYYYLQIDWVLISLPYFLLSIITIQKLEEYIQNKLTFKMLLVWIIIPILAIVPGALVLIWRSTIFLEANFGQYTLYTFMPIFSILVLVVIWPLNQLIQGLQLGGEVDSEIDDLLHPDNEVGKL